MSSVPSGEFTTIQFGDGLTVSIPDPTAPETIRVDAGGPSASIGDTVPGKILATGPAGFWRLNETSGTVAHDSSGNGHDMSPRASGAPPTWNQTPGPPGDPTALFPGVSAGSGSAASENVGMPSAFLNNFTAGVWVKLLASPGLQMLIGQGTPMRGGAGANVGWCIAAGSGAFYFQGGSSALLSSAVPTVGQWYFLAFVRDAGAWKPYVNGVLQAATGTGSPGVGSTNTWFWEDGSASTGATSNTLLSNGFITNSVVPGAQLLDIYTTGTTGVAPLAGKVWTAIGDGTSAWQFPHPPVGPTSARPGTTVVGFNFYDTTLGKPIWWNGSAWKDAAGTTV